MPQKERTRLAATKTSTATLPPPEKNTQKQTKNLHRKKKGTRYGRALHSWGPKTATQKIPTRAIAVAPTSARETCSLSVNGAMRMLKMRAVERGEGGVGEGGVRTNMAKARDGQAKH